MKRLIAAMAVMTLLATGCGDDEDDGGGAASTTTEAPATTEPTALAVENSATAEKTFTAPAEISGGVVNMTFKNNGKLVHEAALIQIGDKPEEEAVRDFLPVVSEEGSPIPGYLEPSGGINEVPAGQSATSTLTLPAGRYLIICTLDDAASRPEEEQEQEDGPELPPHFQQGMRKLLTVTGGAAEASALPQGDGTVVARDYTFDVPTNLTPGKKQLVFRNDGPAQIHHGIFFEFPAGTDEAAARRAFEAFAMAEEAGRPPPEGTPEPEEAGYSSVFNPGRAGTFELTLNSGRTYAVLCFIQDRSGSPPHAFSKGMMKTFTVK